jgi:hypothetical protein
VPDLAGGAGFGAGAIVPRIFLSHSSVDSRSALALRRWLGEVRPQLANEIFLDIDPESGLQIGDGGRANFSNTIRAVRR